MLDRGDLSADDQPKIDLEIAFADLCRQAGLPKPEINRYLLLGDEYHEVDFLWRSERVVIETDGGSITRTAGKGRETIGATSCLRSTDSVTHESQTT